MPRIFDNIELPLLPTLKETLQVSYRADFCVGYFNLRGWSQIDTPLESWQGGPDSCCRVLIGMQSLPRDTLRSILSLHPGGEDIDNGQATRLKRAMAEDFRAQLAIGRPTNADEEGLRRLSAQLRSGKVIVKLHLRHLLHAKLYLCFRHDPNNPITDFVGSSNLTLSGLQHQGELNVDVLDHDACTKLAHWFDARWEDRWCLDISSDLADIIDSSWARETLIPPYHIYLKMAYHLSQEARAGLAEFTIPRDFGNKLLDFQVAAVKIAAHHLNKRGGVLIGDVVGLGKTLMATALARVMQDDHGMETLIICPKNLVRMWEDYRERYHLFARVLPISQVIRDLPALKRYRLILIDESHNLRNPDTKRFKAIRKYIDENDSKCILLTATPYNKRYLDLSAQLRLFLSEQQDLGIRPETLLRRIGGEVAFRTRYTCAVNVLEAFEKSEEIDDWRELMRLFLVRRTRGFIKENYADVDPANGRSYLTFQNGDRTYLPVRVPRTVRFAIHDDDPADPYARLYANEVVTAINALVLPRYGLGNYLVKRPTPTPTPTPTEQEQIKNLGRAGQRLMGFCRTNLFKRLESGGPAFIQSIERHCLRNFVFAYALEHDLPLPIGPQEAELLDLVADEDEQSLLITGEDENGDAQDDASVPIARTEDDYRREAERIYQMYQTRYRSRFKWLRASLFASQLASDLVTDARSLLGVRTRCGIWDANRDTKLGALFHLLTKLHPNEKVLIFSQFADTVHYLTPELQRRGVQALEGVTGDSADPTELAWRFSPISNDHQIEPGKEIRVLVATDVLSEGQNLQDCAIVVNYDLPWAIIRLIQRAGRVDRLGQQSPEIRCYSFLPAEGVERIINLRARVRQRLRENAQVVGTDERFFEDDADDAAVVSLYHEKAGILDGDAEGEVDLASYAFQIWKNATEADPSLKKAIDALPDVVFSARQYIGTSTEPQSVLLYVRTAQGNDALLWVDEKGQPVTQSQYAILRAAECSPNTPAIPRHPRHHEMVEDGVRLLAQEERNVGGQLGRPGSLRRRVYDRLSAYARGLEGTLFGQGEEYQLLCRAVEQIYKFPFLPSTADTLTRQIKSGVSETQLAELATILYREDRLCHVQEEAESGDPHIICSLGLWQPGKTSSER